jgi:CHAT domain-containing protein/tetratricopeptide (TPR) repeat protein
MWGRVLVGLLLTSTSVLFAAAPPLGPDRPLTAEERRVLVGQLRQALARYQTQRQAGQLKEAIGTAREVVALVERLEGSWNEAVVRGLERIAQRSRAVGADEQAITYAERAYRLRQRLHPTGDWRIVDARLHLEEMRNHARRDEAARQQLQKAERLDAQVVRLYQQGKSKEALPLAQEALTIRRQLLGEKHPDYARSLLNLGEQYHALYQNRQAEECYLRALALRKELLGEKHPAYATGLSRLARLYFDMGEYARARPLLEQALALNRETLGPKHPNYAASLNNLAVLYREIGEYGRARPLYEQALALTKELLGEKHPEYAGSLNNLAGLYFDLGEYARARSLFEQALALHKQLRREKHWDYATDVNNLAILYQAMGEYARARSLFEQALALKKELGGEKHTHYAQSLGGLALLDWQEGQAAQASKQLASALQIVHQHVDTDFSALSGRQRLQLLAQTRLYLDDYLSLSAVAKLPAGEVHQAVLAWKGMAGARAAEEQILRDSPALAPLLEELRRKRAGLAHLSANPPTPANRDDWVQRYRDLDRQREDLEFRLAQQSAAFRALRAPDPRAVAAALPKRSALVDLLEYRHRTPDPERAGKWLFERRLVAFVVSRGKEVVRVELGAVQPIAEAVLAWRRPMQTFSALDAKAAGLLRGRLWDKLAPSLAGCNTVLISPDGVLCALPWSALPGNKPGSFLLEEIAIAQLTSARQLLAPPNKVVSSGLLALGGLDYGKGGAAGKGWVALPGTALEARAVVKLHQERFLRGRAPDLLEGAAVDKAALAKALSPGKWELSWRQIHLATHGYFDQTSRAALALAARGGGQRGELPGEEAVPLHLDPLLGCGLVLSGANQDSERGTLTALEVANLDLRGCELVVLSACDTGLGKLEAGEGVLGLQSAFHLAGARTVVASLWSVNDPATSVLMERFYRNLWADRPLTRLEALRQAQLFVLKNPEAVRQRARELREAIVKAGRGSVEELRGKGKEVELSEPRPPGSGGLSHPAWWAAFVLSGEIGPVPH